MAETITIARPYAKAVFEHAREHNTFAQWSDLLALASAIVADPNVKKLLASPRVTPAQLVEFIADILGEKLDEKGRNFLNLLAQNRRLASLPDIAAIYEELRAEAERIADVQVVSAMALDDSQRARLTSALKKRLGREVRLHERVDPSLIGGAVVRAGDLVIDGSLKARLERLAQEIAQ
ncbi:MAG TPA: F0F1 ATP synthase subunit delta [Steroidobacteraceae bacterium]|jgi:F-type H+-transporting ATPase subunit delta